MDANFRVDLNAIREVIESTDVFLIRFGQIEQRLLVDARPDEGGAPFIKIVPPVRSAEGRYRYLKKARPGMKLLSRSRSSDGRRARRC